MTQVLSIVATAHRATLEEQDDTILWLTSMCSGAGLQVEVLLEGSSVNYGVRGQDAGGLRVGDVAIVNPPSLDRDIGALIGSGVPVHYIADDAAALGIDEATLVGGLKSVTRAELPALFERFDQVWRW